MNVFSDTDIILQVQIKHTYIQITTTQVLHLYIQVICKEIVNFSAGIGWTSPDQLLITIQ